MFDMMGMMGKMKDFQARMKEAQDDLEGLTATGEAGGGLVKATANARQQVLKIEVDESLFSSPDDRAMVTDLTVAAVNAALKAAGELARDHIKSKTAGLLPNTPGMDLGQFGL